MVAIYGHETNYGSFTGDFDLIRSLATLAFEGRRRALFEPDLIAALKMLDNGVPRARLVGSWAGARSEEHTSELQSLMRTSYAVFCLQQNTTHKAKKTICQISSQPHNHTN